MGAEINSILVTLHHISENESRNREYRICLNKNLENPLISTIVLLSEKRIIDPTIVFNPKIRVSYTRKRPTYWDAFKAAWKYKKRIFNRKKSLLIVCNSDIYISSDSINKMYCRVNKKTCLALSRWNAFVTENLTIDYELFNRRDSQDTWVFFNSIKKGRYRIPIGIQGCDNRIAKELTRAGYDVKNPSLTIVTNHLHLSEVRTYTDSSKRIKGPYFLVDLTE
jgi:hypothetical protein